VFAIISKPAKDKLFSTLKIDKDSKVIKVLDILMTFILVSIAWVFFRSNNIHDAFYILSHLFSNISFSRNQLGIGAGGIEGLIYSFSIILFMEFIHLIQEHKGVRLFLNNKPLIVRWGIYLLILLLILLFGVFQEVKFIYFQF
jgi:hypothetical protein